MSVIIPVYNVESYIDDCMLSLRVQNYGNFEIIVVNDGSTDCSMQRVCAHAAIDHRIKIIDQENQGLGGARNTGLAQAKGDFVIFADSDDMLTTKAIHTLARAQRAGDFDIVSARYITISESSEVLRRELSRSLPTWEPPISHYESVLGLFHHGGAWARLYRRRTLLHSGVKFPTRLQGYEDLCFTYKVLRGCKSHYLEDEFIYYWRQRSHSIRYLTKDHFCVPSLMRDDTREFLDRVSASEREYVLAARRNILIISNLLKRSRGTGAELSELFLKLLRNNRSEIMDDFYITDRTELKCEAHELRELL